MVWQTTNKGPEKKVKTLLKFRDASFKKGLMFFKKGLGFF